DAGRLSDRSKDLPSAQQEFNMLLEFDEAELEIVRHALSRHTAFADYQSHRTGVRAEALAKWRNEAARTMAIIERIDRARGV
ncbi:MAG: hypothetical protein C5B60_02645, partial [Chloroflexi bacterium]